MPEAAYMETVSIDDEATRGQDQILLESDAILGDLVRLAAQVCQTPIAFINLIDPDPSASFSSKRQHLKAKVGLEITELPPEHGLCSLCVTQKDILVIPDTQADQRWANNPIVSNAPSVRFYTGVPLILSDGHAIGTLCVADQTPRQLDSHQIETLRILGRQVLLQLESRQTVTKIKRLMQEQQHTQEELRQREHEAEIARGSYGVAPSANRIRSILESITDAFFALDTEWKFTYINRQAEHLLQHTASELIGKNLWEEFPDAIATSFDREYHRAVTEQVSVSFEEFYPPLNAWFEVHAYPRPEGLSVYFRDITDRRQTEIALREGEEQLRVALEAAQMGTWNWNISTNEITWSANLEALFGLEPGSFDGRYETFVNLLHPDDRERVLAEISNAVHSGKEYNTEFRVVFPNGQMRWAASRGQVFHDDQGRPIRMAGVDLDITERKRAEEALKESEERWQLALRGNNDGIWDWNVVTNEVFFSPRWKEMIGYEDHEIANHLDEWAKRVHPDDLEWVTQAIQDHFNKKTPFYITEHRMQCKDGTYKWILDRGQALWDESGHPVRMVGSHTDVTSRKLAEAELQRQHHRTQLFAEITLKIRQSLQPEVILQTAVTEVQKLLHADRVLVFRLWEDGSGTVVEEAVVDEYPAVLGQSILDPCFQQDYQAQYQQGRVSAIENIHTAAIQPCHVDFLQQFGVQANLVVPVLLREELWGLLIAHQCRQPRQWSSFEVELLKQLADQMGIALSQARSLEQETRQRQELAASNAELEQFAYVASHDLQEPLRIVTSYLQLLERRYKHQLDDGADEFIHYAVDGASRMQALIRDLLQFSRVSTRGQVFEKIDCHTALMRAIANLKVSIDESGAEITYDALPEVMADATQLTQVFQNLIGNAIKFRGERPIRIHIGVSQNLNTEKSNPPSVSHLLTQVQTPAVQSDWCFSVQDNGIGIDPQYHDRIFVIFQRLHGRSKYPGTGIGLAICKKIIERHHGRMWVESEPGQGATFYFTIPEIKENAL